MKVYNNIIKFIIWSIYIIVVFPLIIVRESLRVVRKIVKLLLMLIHEFGVFTEQVRIKAIDILSVKK